MIVRFGGRSSDPRREAKIVGSYLSGSSIAGIHEGVGVPRETVRTILHSRGIHMRHVHAICHKPNANLDHDTALLLGLHAGDGHLSSYRGISINTKGVEMGRCIFSLVGKTAGVEPYIDRRRDGCFIVKSGKKQVFRFFKRFGFAPGREAGTVEVPKETASSGMPEYGLGF